jgi:hypothetical protein
MRKRTDGKTMAGRGVHAAALLALLALALLAGAGSVQAQLTDDARTSTQGTQFVKPAPKPEPPPAAPPAPPPPSPAVDTAPPAAVEAPKPPPPPPAKPPRFPSVVFLVDTSDSMLNRTHAGGTRTRLDEAKDALIQVLRDMAPDTRVQVWTFNTRMVPITVPGVPEGSFIEIGRGENRARLIDRVRLFRTAGGTNLYQSITRALAFFADPRDQAAYRSGLRFPVLVVLSDGEDGGKTQDTLQGVQKAKAQQAHVTVNTIGFNLAGDQAWFQVLCRIATRPDGCATADDQANLQRLLDSFYKFRAGK